MTLFEPRHFNTIKNRDKYKYQPDFLLEHGDTFEIYPGDIFLLPPHYYHIGKTEKFSIGIAIAISKYPKKLLTSKFLKEALKDKMFSYDIETVKNMISNDNITLLDWVSEKQKSYYFLSRSRGGLRYSYRDNTELKFNFLSQFIFDETFKAELYVERERIHIVARGNSLKLDFNKSVFVSLGRLLSLEEKFTVNGLYNSKNYCFSKDDLQYLIKMLYSFGIVRKVSV